ncbi:hypothetical protein K488DRAFT_88482 [Vararia minispora EC-137]|uniref:Uncharacterized protein n=1 Tax=Vararia minispora EC-137 TaxID=1314806 RepID=A0ACB8QDM5_9AGAM|nr:hypothetical protein K488DRAFT_88482 [Vararia minispora EC-137]
MLGAIGALAFINYRLFLKIMALFRGAPVPKIFKRGAYSAPLENSLAGIDFYPLIPGLTLPISEFPILFVALSIAQAFHEVGHAIAAAISSVPLHSVGASLALVIPAFFVALPSPLPARSAPRIAAAGAFHNFLLVTVLSLPIAAWILPLFGFSDVSRNGVAVTYVDSDSDLYAHLPIGAVISSLEDVSLAEGVTSWTRFFASSSAEGTPGWCADSDWLVTQPTSADATTANRLYSKLVLCVVPVPLPNGRLVLWRGPRLEVYEQVHVSNYLRYRFTPFPQWFADTAFALISYQ